MPYFKAVEIGRHAAHTDLLSSDADFVSLLRYLKTQEKKAILIKGGRISGSLIELKINAQDITQYITVKKQKPGF